MAKISVSEFISAPIDLVFDTASNFGEADQFIGGITNVEVLTEGDVGVGTRFKETRIMFRREATETMEVVKFDRPYHYALLAYNCGCEYHSSFDFVEKDGGTQVTMNFEGIPKKFLAKVMAFMMGWMLKMVAKECTKDLCDLKNYVESNALAS